MVDPSPSGPRQPQPVPAASPEPRDAWLILALDGPVTQVAGHPPSAAVRIVADPSRFEAILLRDRPRIVVCAQPPADARVLELVAAERRRRSAMRAVHLAPAAAVGERLAALAAGFDDALTSDTPAAELIGRLAWLDMRSGPRPRARLLPVADGVELDLSAHELRRGTERVHLRPKEYGLLALLAGRPGRAFTRRELLDRVWGPDHRGGVRTVDVHVRWLRTKIEPAPERPVHLVTVHGVGYRLDAPQR